MNANRNRKSRFSRQWAYAIASVCSSVFLQADQVTWTGVGSEAYWSAAGNWSSGAAPVPGDGTPGSRAGDSLIFAGTSQQENTNDLTFGYFSDLVFQNGGFVMNGSGPGLSGNITCTGNNTINTGLVLGGSGVRFIKTAADSTLTIEKVLNFQSGTLQDDSFGTTVLNATCIQAGTLNVFSFGLTVLGGDNSAYTGKIQIFRFAKLTNPKGLGGASTTVALDRSFAPASLDLNGLEVSGVDLSFASVQNPSSTQLARLRNTSTTPAAFDGEVNLLVTGAVDGSGDLALNGCLSGGGGLDKLDTGVLTLTGTNTYTGQTSVSGGTLVVNGAIGNSPVEVKSGAKLGGSGKLDGPVTMAPGSVLVLGFNTKEKAVLTINNTLHLGGTTEVTLNRSNPRTVPRISGVTTLTLGGNLSVRNAGAALQANDTFPLFKAKRIEGNFSAMDLPPLSPGLGWDWNPSTGTLGVRRTLPALPGKTTPVPLPSGGKTAP